jgi:hypothetical protein
MVNTPDSWVIVKIVSGDNKDTTYKVLAGWSGGYLQGDSWKLNSGITSVEEDGDYYLFHGYSRSIYRCHKTAEGMSGMMHGILWQMQESPHASVEVVPVSELKIVLDRI